MDKQEQLKLRRQLLELMNQDINWYLYPDTKLYKEITAIGKKLFHGKSNFTYNEITEERYERLRAKGYTYLQIAAFFHVSKEKLVRWREAHGYKQVKNKKMEESA